MVINYIKGEIIEVYEGKEVYIVLETSGGIAYEVYTNNKTISELRDKIGLTIKINTYLQVGQDILKIYGLLTQEEMRLFKTIINVNGIGAKVGMNILEMDPHYFCMAIATNDIGAVTKINGIGKKTGERLILELKDKVMKSDKDENYKSSLKVSEGETLILNESKNALMALGYTSKESRETLDKIYKKGMDISQIIKLSLASLASK